MVQRITEKIRRTTLVERHFIGLCFIVTLLISLPPTSTAAVFWWEDDRSTYRRTTSNGDLIDAQESTNTTCASDCLSVTFSAKSFRVRKYNLQGSLDFGDFKVAGSISDEETIETARTTKREGVPPCSKVIVNQYVILNHFYKCMNLWAWSIWEGSYPLDPNQGTPVTRWLRTFHTEFRVCGTLTTAGPGTKLESSTEAIGRCVENECIRTPH